MSRILSRKGVTEGVTLPIKDGRRSWGSGMEQRWHEKETAFLVNMSPPLDGGNYDIRGSLRILARLIARALCEETGSSLDKDLTEKSFSDLLVENKERG